MKQTIEQCIWKEIAQRESHPEGKLRHCYLYCDGLQTNCEYYISSRKVKGLVVRNGLERFRSKYGDWREFVLKQGDKR